MAAVELAFVLPLLTFLCMMTIDFSRVIYALIVLQNCARNGALYEFYSAPDVGGSLPSNWDDLSTAVQADLGRQTDQSRLVVTPQNPISFEATSPGASSNNYVTVTVTYNFPLIALGPLQNLPAIPNSLPLTQSVSMPYPDSQNGTPSSFSIGGTITGLPTQ